MLPWFFALDHTNYARWLTVFIDDLRNLPEDGILYTEFSNGKFMVNKTQRLFSSMEEDQAHEQHNKIIKMTAELWVFSTTTKLCCSGPYMGQSLAKYLKPRARIKKGHHHEDTDSSEATF